MATDQIQQSPEHVNSQHTPGPWVIANNTDIFTPDRHGNKLNGFQIATLSKDKLSGNRHKPQSPRRKAARNYTKGSLTANTWCSV